MNGVMVVIVCILSQMLTHQDRPVSHLYAPHTYIPEELRGTMLELINSAPVLKLPASPPKRAANGEPWALDVKNLGPASVTITGKNMFTIHVGVGATVHIMSDGITYSRTR